jgi:hypothetical protein
MGSTQSSSSSTSSSTDAKESTVAVEKDDTEISFHKDQSKANNLEGMALVNYKCKKRKKKYEKCTSEWYSKQFMTGKSMNQEEICGDLFEKYRTCILKGIRSEVWDKQGLPPPLEGSPLSEVEEDDDKQ